MPIDYPGILELKDQGRRFSWSDRETILYALAIGMGADPLDRKLLPFVYEKNLKAMPTLATVIAWGASIPADRLGTDRRHTLHGEESLTLHSPLPAAGEVVADSRVRAVYDKGEKGAVIERETVLRDAVSGVLIATIIRTAFARKDGGFGGPVQQSAPHAPPARSPDVVLEFATRPDQADSAWPVYLRHLLPSGAAGFLRIRSCASQESRGALLRAGVSRRYGRREAVERCRCGVIRSRCRGTRRYRDQKWAIRGQLNVARNLVYTHR